MYPYLFDGAFRLPTFKILITLGVLSALWVFFMLAKRYRIGRDATDNLILLIPVILLGGFFFAMVFDKIAHWGEDVWYKPAGMAFSGGLVGAALLVVALYRPIIKKKHRDIVLHLEIFAPCVVVAHAFGRIGCFLGGCCFGKPTDSFLGVHYPHDSLAYQTYGGVKILPTQLFEAVFLLALFAVLFFFVHRYKVSVYLISYSIFRFVIELFRGDNRGFLSGAFSPSQILSLIMFVSGIAWIFIYKRFQTPSHKNALDKL